MFLLMCVDDDYGLAFNGRRQSRDRAVTADMLRLAGKSKLWIGPESKPLFTVPDLGEAWENRGGVQNRLQVAEDFLDRAKAGEYCFAERLDSGDLTLRDRVEELILYRWNRKYPADMYLQWDFQGFRVQEIVEFPGYSHERITRERYVKGMKE